jgi:multiple sugar transport system substrate-binding protein
VVKKEFWEKYNVGASRRTVMKGAAGLAAAGAIGTSRSAALAQDDLRAQILAIPGAGNGQPTEQDMQKVGELCMGPTKANVAEGEFSGVKLTFMGLNNQNLHNIVFRNLLHSFVEYSGVEIEWIDLAQADYNPRLQTAIATKTIDFDIVEMGAPYEGDVCGAGLTSIMPDWVKEQIDVSDYVGYLQPPVGTWNGDTFRVNIDGDCHNFNYRSDYFSNADLAAAWTAAGNTTEWGVPKTYQEVQAVSKFLKDQQVDGQQAYGWLDVCKPGGGFSWYFFASRASAYAKHPDDPAWLFDADTMKPRINNPAFVRAIQDVIDLVQGGFSPPDQINADLNVTGFSQFLGGTGSMCAWWGDVGSSVYTNDQSVVQDKVAFDILPGSDDVYNSASGAWDTLPDGPSHAPNMAYLGWGIYVMSTVDTDPVKQKAAWSIAAFLGGKDISIWTVAYPSGFQPYRNSHFDVAEWVATGYPEDFATSYLASEQNSYNHPNAAIEPRIPGIFQYYSAAEDELAKAFAGQVDAQTCADNIAAAWEGITDQIGRDQQLALYQASLGITGDATPVASPVS